MRAVALLCILVVHFNAAVTGYFTLPHKLFGSTLPFGIYLGDFGSTLFFIVSGAALALTTRPETQPLAFYKKRAKAVYPLFWLAWGVCFSIRFLTKPGYYAAAKTPTLVLTALGLDQFALAAGWVHQDFACVGEWFLGSILFLYLLFPLLQWGLRCNVWLTWAAALAASLTVHHFGWDTNLVAVHLPEFLFGMSYPLLPRRGKLTLLPALCVGLLLCWRADEKLTSALLGMAVFLVLAFAARWLEHPRTGAFCAWLAKLSYPVFLLHHVIILRMVEPFDLAALTRRDTAFLFLIYLAATFAAAQGLLWAYHQLRAAVAVKP